MTIERRDVALKTGDSFAAGWFYLPEPVSAGVRKRHAEFSRGTQRSPFGPRVIAFLAPEWESCQDTNLWRCRQCPSSSSRLR